jgi:hypothetical protein
MFVAGEIGESMFHLEALISPVVVPAASGFSLRSRDLEAVPDNLHLSACGIPSTGLDRSLGSAAVSVFGPHRSRAFLWAAIA